MAVREGDVLAGKYRVEKLLGMGGMGAVVAAHHLQLDERVALKFLLPESCQVPEAVARFTREARAATKVKNEHVVRIIDVGSFESGEPYMVMEYLEGSDLGAVVRDGGPLTPDVAADYLLQACEALAEAHALGIIHRDLKPSNLFLSKRMDGTALVKVLDFGISKVTGTAGSGPDLGLTKTTAMMGSPLYMSPEQMSSARDVDTRTDIWALGVILYEFLVGNPPFNADTVPQLCAMVLQQEPEPLRERRPDLPPGLDAILARCLRKAPAERYPNVAELALALGEFAPKHARASVKRITGIIQTAGLSASALAFPPSSTDVAPPPLQQTSGTAVSWSETPPVIPIQSSRPALIIGIMAVALVGLVGLIFAARFLLRGSPEVAPSAVAATAAPPSAPNVEPASNTARTPTPLPEVSPEPPASAAAELAAAATKTPKVSTKTVISKTASSGKPAPSEKPASVPPKPKATPGPAVPSGAGGGSNLGGRT